ncbi:flavodoxin [Clostridium sp. MD294]|uniref:flavodoxin n=1 Tax=Clostridium sp. MD294 TaxID=97138 RepID=UPI0002CC410E|nr:flavodoxin [Clostridium sp. MD294]NDO45947.1 flavodoxin [Clostridium sp. MD294]USF30394.1 hypothetical protein C820_001835 [Clostridium sp. MD294]
MTIKLKDFFTFVIVVCIMFSSIACKKSNVVEQQNKNENKTEYNTSQKDTQKIEQKNSPETENTKKEILVVYFSATGTTKNVAEKIANITNADIYEIVPSNPYSDEDLDYNDKNSRTSMEKNDATVRTEIASETIQLDNYSIIYIGYPIWWGEAPRIMSTFVESYDFSDIKIIPFCTSASSGIEKSIEQLEQQSASGVWLSGKRFSGDVSEEELQNWIEELQ